ncbi:2-succinyl-5-enolpyruvyl-6-hydroxy-3-cyclohexene-1-carboxylic-acid synthase [Urechidicola croceus]|uniref:2-succinyl-5-enolpyruvyl-6-hydroxy-3-cyclohexene-1-carboxylate synthase n=1 Tax=Urechidicola croceus TaxID=1850246 RepID=A0A1D8P409_9FLAO|nr:2-succinyl-5-enolpyruvyl-6-hydroxy-3-cyclohexene-1-carboxylic-acid synthase [Urechidicola croceus]AOW19251.1 2-succinyl-5-enolpyruvyl-6-hydroxy-3-cyclohexene-1-carboxylic-acid synthase [Urechidicola croceus]
MQQYPKNDLAQLVIASCVAHDIEHVVISPGSRNAPLTIGFSNHKSIQTYSIVDERCAGFFALGLAQQLKQPVAVICTSGSALLNYYPAVSEAFYSDVPLVVISADRPKHLIDIGDGQTIRQENVFQNHILSSTNLKVDSKENEVEIQEALERCILKNGPIHINVPFDEPLYEVTNQILEIQNKNIKFKEEPLDVDELQNYADIWNSSTKKMVLIGTNYPDELLQIQLNKIIEDPSVIVLTETTSNVFNSNFINSIDNIIFPLENGVFEELKPEVLITLGGMIVSKKVKQFLRKYQPKHHWHIDSKKAYDTYFCLEKHFEITPQLFFSQFFFLTEEKNSGYQKYWLDIKEYRSAKHKEFLKGCSYSDLKVFETVLDSIPNNLQLQMSNSAIIRYSQLFDLKPSLSVFCNRGTSGIDGSTSTAIGASIAVNEQTVFITGDVSFFYDSNALWNKYIRKDFRIILINNDGGGIFKIIPGPKETNALSYFETTHGLSAKHLCEMFNLEYISASNLKEVNDSFKEFYSKSEVPKLLEIFTPSDENDLILKSYFKALK